MTDQTIIPDDEPVLVDLDPGEGKEPIVKAEPKQPAVKAKEEQPPAPEKKKDDGAARLLEQLQASEKARKEAERRANEADERAREANARVASTETDLVQNGLSAAQAELASAEQELQSAGEAADWGRMAKAQARIGRAAADIRGYERDAAMLAERKEAEAKQPKPEPRQEQQMPVDIEQAIDSMQILPAEKIWLKKHPEVMLDAARNQEVAAGYIRATREGLHRGTEEYFKFLDEFMGFAKPAPKAEDAGESEERTNVVSAPVSRESRSMANGDRQNRTQVRLSAQEREMADMMGIPYADYARGKLQMDDDKAANPEKFANRR